MRFVLSLVVSAVLCFSQIVSIQADSSALEEWRHAVRQDVRLLPPDQVARVIQEAVRASDVLLRKRGVAFDSVRLGDTPYLSFRILPQLEGSPLNRFAAAFEGKVRGVALVYAPAFLLGGSSSFFSESTRSLGISSMMIEYEIPDPLFFYELVHASHFIARAAGVIDPLSGTVAIRIMKGDLSVGPQRSSFSKSMAFDELEANVGWLRALAIELKTAVEKRLPKRELDGILTEMKKVAKSGTIVSTQIMDVSDRASDAKAWTTDTDWQRVDARDAGSWVTWRRSIQIDAYLPSPRKKWVTYPSGAELVWTLRTLRSATPLVTRANLTLMLSRSSAVATQLSHGFLAIDETMRGAMRPDSRRTNLPRLMNLISNLDATFAGWKVNSSKTPIPRF